MKLYISTGNSRMEKKWNGQEMEFSVFLERLSHTVRTSETMEQYRKLSKAKQDSIKDVGGFVLGKLKGGRRKKANVLFRSGLTLDMDYATEDIAEQIELFFDFRCLIYSTHKHTPEKPRLRLIIPLSRTVSPDEYAAVARKVAEDIGMELFDDTTYEPSRLMYWPSTSADGEFFFRDIPGTFLNPDSVLERYADWRDSSSWPVSSRQKAVVSREMKKQADPLSKEGIVGAFCRTYSIEEAIRIFLPDVYQESMMPERFDYIPADSQAGVVIYEGKFAYSHHATDPACGKLLNAFDIVRIHKFGEQDDKAEEGTDAGKLPSFKAMSDFAVSDEQVKRTLAKEREKAASEEFDTDTGEWQTMLDLDRQGKVKDTLSNIATIIRFDENLQPIVFNQLKNALDVIGELPWVQVKKGWGDADIACAKLYFERVYGIWSPTKFKDALLAVVSSERLYHPVKEYFSTLSWDGWENGVLPTERYSLRETELGKAYDEIGETPYLTYTTGWKVFVEMLQFGLIFGSILIICGVSTIFAEESQTKMLPLIFSTVEGKQKDVYAKIIASFTFVIAIFLWFILVNLALCWVVYGLDGFGNISGMVLSRNVILSAFKISFLKYLSSLLGLGFQALLSLCAITLCVSANQNSSFGAVIAAAICWGMPILIRMLFGGIIWIIVDAMPIFLVMEVIIDDIYDIQNIVLGINIFLCVGCLTKGMVSYKTKQLA